MHIHRFMSDLGVCFEFAVITKQKEAIYLREHLMYDIKFDSLENFGSWGGLFCTKIGGPNSLCCVMTDLRGPDELRNTTRHEFFHALNHMFVNILTLPLTETTNELMSYLASNYLELLDDPRFWETDFPNKSLTTTINGKAVTHANVRVR